MSRLFEVCRIELYLIERELDWEFVRSRGPGGQNVNKTNSAAILRWPILSSRALSEEQKQKILQQKLIQVTQEGALLIRSEESRHQIENQKNSLEKLEQFLLKLFAPVKKRKPTKPTFSSQRKRVDSKKHRSEIKSNRRRLA